MSQLSMRPPKNPATPPMKSPMTRINICTKIATDSDTRAPWIRRLRTSRPTSSVPSRWTLLGRAYEAPGKRRFGSYGASTSAKIATATMNRMKAIPATASLLRSKRRHASRQSPRDVRFGTETLVTRLGWPGATMVVEAIRVAMNLAIRNPRIDERVQDVDHEVQRGDGKGIQQRRAHDQ